MNPMYPLTQKLTDFTEDLKNKTHEAIQKTTETGNSSIKGRDDMSVTRKWIFSTTVVPRKQKSPKT